MTVLDVCWIDRQYDRGSATAGSGRFVEHVRRNAGEFDDCWGDISPVRFACTVWRLATVPRLDPGYVRFHRRILSAECARNEWDGSLLARVQVAGPVPEALSRSRVWTQDRGWRGWPTTFGQFLAPSQRELSRFPHVRPVLLVDAPLPLEQLPPVPDAPPPDLPELAERTVGVLVRELDGLLAPMVSACEQ
ncbi:hypothetical protein GCM10023322_35680 [Rugosimonospora acidiphila]|uniref:Uncharacterized protein n=1 Tax=Rugosimonospora acidiphila TaxID=556531 RepID=A0ABP9RVM5_9ACTN